jgi:hypothetical protein
MKFSGKISILATLLIFSSFAVKGQERDSSRYGIGIITGQDTVIERNIREVWVYPTRQFKSARYEKQYWRLVQRVKKVLPYAKTANQLLRKYEPEYLTLTKDRDKRKLIKRVEDELMAQYKEEFKKMSITDGKVLIKLIDRETGRTSFTLIKEFRGAFIATFWQGIARLFGNNLKDEFDPYGEDLLIDEIATMIEIGFL